MAVTSNYFELPPAALNAPYCPQTGFNGCSVAVCADMISAYTGEQIRDLVALGRSMGQRHRNVDPSIEHGICPHAWCAYCIFLELYARGVPVRYAPLTWAQILAQLEAGHHVACPGEYGQIGYVAPGTYSASVPALGRSDSFTGPHMLELFGSTGTRIRAHDPDFGNQRGTPPYSLLAIAQVEAFWQSLSYPVAFTTAPPTAQPLTLHYHAQVIVPTALWNDGTQRWVYNGPNRIKAGTSLVVRSKGFTKDGVSCFAVASLPALGPTAGPGYFIPKLHIRLIGGPF